MGVSARFNFVSGLDKYPFRILRSVQSINPEKFRKHLEGSLTKCVYGEIQLLVFVINCFLLPEILNLQL